MYSSFRGCHPVMGTFHVEKDSDEDHAIPASRSENIAGSEAQTKYWSQAE